MQHVLIYLGFLIWKIFCKNVKILVHDEMIVQNIVLIVSEICFNCFVDFLRV